MSIRLRLLLATAVVALVALVAADVVLYTSLRSFLFRQVDNGLELSHHSVEASLSGSGGDERAPSQPLPQAGSYESQCPLFHGRPVNVGGLTPGTVIEVRTARDVTVWHCSIAEAESKQIVPPELPAHLSGFAASPSDPQEKTAYFTAPAQRGEGIYRVRASILRTGPAAGGTLVLAVPIAGTEGTLGTLRDVEIVVTAGALVVALVLGWTLVRTSLHPLRDIERTADAIGRRQRTRHARAGRPPDLRAVLPRGPLTLAPARRRRPRVEHRGGHRPRPRRFGGGLHGPRWRSHLHGRPAGRAAEAGRASGPAGRAERHRPGHPDAVGRRGAGDHRSTSGLTPQFTPGTQLARRELPVPPCTMEPAGTAGSTRTDEKGMVRLAERPAGATMILLYLSIPIMVLGLAIATLPLLAAIRLESRERRAVARIGVRRAEHAEHADQLPLAA